MKKTLWLFSLLLAGCGPLPTVYPSTYSVPVARPDRVVSVAKATPARPARPVKSDMMRYVDRLHRQIDRANQRIEAMQKSSR